MRLGELQHAPETPVCGELGQVLLGSRRARQHEQDVIICDLTGCGAQDAAIAQLACTAFLESRVAEIRRPPFPDDER